MNLSIVIPAYNESKKISQDIVAASNFLNTHRLSGEIIIVDDGSEDDTAIVAKNIDVGNEISLQVFHYDHQKGKGYAVKTGITRSKGDIVMFIDSGLCVPYKDVLKGWQMLNAGICDIAHGSRFLSQSKIIKPHTKSRQISSWVFRKFLTYGMGLPAELTDTQCGLKMYVGEIGRILYEQCITNGFMFDIEMILRAMRQGFRIKEFPVEWTADHDSRLSQMRMPLHVLSELMKIKKALAKK